VAPATRRQWRPARTTCSSWATPTSASTTTASACSASASTPEGRSRRLKINYRTSQQILGWTLGILTGQDIDDLDGNLESEVGYRSALDGPIPTLQRFTTPAEEAEFVAAQIQEWLDDGVAPGAIGITARRRSDLRAVQAAMDDADIRWSEIGSDTRQPGVRTATMHSCKGLEFARLAVIAANADNLPLPVAVDPGRRRRSTARARRAARALPALRRLHPSSRRAARHLIRHPEHPSPISATASTPSSGDGSWTPTGGSAVRAGLSAAPLLAPMGSPRDSCPTWGTTTPPR
jgi:hypothetical protein